MKEKVDILLLGSGGREHALLAKLAESPRAGRLYVAPGNGGMDVMAEKVEGLDAEDPVAVAEWARTHEIGLVVIGPEAPLVAGVADAVRAAGIACFGPNGDAAQMEGSKKFAKQVMSRAGAPTAAYRSFTDEQSCSDYVRRVGAPIVVKADGLAAGKGVIVAKTTEEALAGVHECFSGAFGEAGATVVVEETLDGPECSLLALTDGKTVVPLATAQDHKRALDGDKGPNTGGMGVYSPVPEHLVSEEQLAAMVDVERKVVAELAEEGITYSGCLYGGFMLTSEGPKVLEFNARFGDPETQVVLPLLESDLLTIMEATAKGTLAETEVKFSNKHACCLVLASEGYPKKYETGFPITIPADLDAEVFVAGAKLEDGVLKTSGGRVLGVTALGDTLKEAIDKAYQEGARVTFQNAYCRKDIGARALRAEEEVK